MGAILRRLRDAAGLSVIQAADKIGVKRATVYDWEYDRKKPDPPALRKAMEVYGASDEDRALVAQLRAFGPEPGSGPTDPPAAVA